MHKRPIHRSFCISCLLYESFKICKLFLDSLLLLGLENISILLPPCNIRVCNISIANIFSYCMCNSYIVEYCHTLHISILQYSVLIKFVPTTILMKCIDSYQWRGDAIAFPDGTHVQWCFHSKIFQCNIVAIITIILLQ